MNIYEVSRHHIMPGAVFIVCVPSEAHEKELQTQNKKSKPKLSPKKSDLVNSQSLQKSPADDVRTPLLHGKTNKDYASLLHSGGQKKCLYMQNVMENILKQLEIENSIWTKSLDNNYLQITFTLKIDSLYEEILEILKDYEIGSKYSSSVSVIPCTLHHSKIEHPNHTNTENDQPEIKMESGNSGWSQFLLSIRARLTVAQVVENIKHHAALTFDFICLLVIASVICAIGLVENSNMFLISSMLISPMMGPVMASTFGKVIRDRALERMGVFNEVLGLGIATIIGFIYGTIISISTDKYGGMEWPTVEMTSRGEIRTIGVGCLIALLSGAAVALAVLSDNISSLVGVAISTSLMPPAVNAGLLWSLASVYYLKGNETTRFSSLTHTNYYSDSRAVELTSLGAGSLCLAFVNIVCIYLAGILVFKIKEVAPIASRDSIRRHFWKHDIKIARDYNRTLNGDDTQNIQDDLKTEFADYRKDAFRNRFHSLLDDFHHSTDLTYGSDKIKIRRSQLTWSPCMLSETKKPTMREVSELYNQIVRESDAPETLQFKTPPLAPISAFKNRTTAVTIVEKEEPQPVPENRSEKQMRKGKTFVVTPCIENGKQNCGIP